MLAPQENGALIVSFDLFSCLLLYDFNVAYQHNWLLMYGFIGRVHVAGHRIHNNINLMIVCIGPFTLYIVLKIKEWLQKVFLENNKKCG